MTETDLSFYFIQFVTGLASACSLFLVASGLSIIFGVTRIVNFAHGAFYMLGAYVGFTLTDRLSGAVGFWGAIALAAIVVAMIGTLVEIVLLRRIYDSPELFQLLATFGVTLAVEDLVLLIGSSPFRVGGGATAGSGGIWQVRESGSIDGCETPNFSRRRWPFRPHGSCCGRNSIPS